ncbi:hypothetical protein BGZ65_002389 [Modicella reniformis]|uniref:Uncharacterized protein n=1 Tax=Modicella reniformis TaxID=1440133 RepID=A0A9P6J0V2_9FUNG|nr:hypothetical protein BGZ65_002389 [Modicella reniformis]
MSRNKAAIAKSKLELPLKAETSTTEDDTQMVDATPANPCNGGLDVSPTSGSLTPLDGSRKRGRDTSSMLDEDDAESTAREEDSNTTNQSNDSIQSHHSLVNGQSADQKMDYQHDPLQLSPSLEVNPGSTSREITRQQAHASLNNSDTVQVFRTQDEKVVLAGAVDEVSSPTPNSPTIMSERKDQVMETTVGSSKLSLSFLLG